MDNFREVATIDLPSRFGQFSLTTYELHYPTQPGMRYALLVRGKETPETPLVRIQSSCVFGEVFHTTTCDCGEQLEKSLEMIAAQGGMMFYLDQEGRGHGLITKTQELALQQTEGLDTVEASEKLGLKPDDRDFTVVSDILKSLNITNIRLLTNNPKKVRELEAAGIHIAERVPLEIDPTDDNMKYLTAKKHKFGHFLSNIS